MDLIETFDGVESRIRGWLTMMLAASDNEEDTPAFDTVKITADLSATRKTFDSCTEQLKRQLGASSRAAKALKDFIDALREYTVKWVRKHFIVIRRGSGKQIWIPLPLRQKLIALTQLAETLKETLQQLESVCSILDETIANSEEASKLSDLEIDRLKEEEERWRREQEEEEQRRKEEERKRKEEERKRKEEEQKRKEEERKIREEERRRKEEEAREQKRQEEVRKRQEEKERRRQEEERKRQEEEERRRQEEERRRLKEEQRIKEEMERKRQEEEKRRQEEEKRRQEEEQRRQEEEQRRQEEIERKRQEEEERIRKEEEEKERMRLEEERRRKEEEQREAERRRKQEAEERRVRKAEQLKREAEEREQKQREEERQLRQEEKSWKPTVLQVTDSRLDTRHGCAIRAPAGSFITDEFRCTVVTDLVGTDSFAPSEELVGNVIRLEAIGRSELGANFRGRRVEWFVLLPHCAQRIPGRETVLYACKNDRWQELPTEEVQLDGLPSEHRWVESRISDLSMTLVPVNRWRIHRFGLTRQGAEVVSQVDSRIRLSIPPESFSPRTATLEQSFEVRPVEASLIGELRLLHRAEFAGLLATSAMVIHTSSVTRAVQPQLMYTLHLPRNGQQIAVPQSADTKNSVHTTIIAMTDSRNGKSHWKALETTVDSEANVKERLTVHMTNLASRKLMALKVGEEFKLEYLDFICQEIETAMVTKTAWLLVRQSADSRQAMVALASKQSAPLVLATMAARGFESVTSSSAAVDPDGPHSGVELRVMERQVLQIELTGNISCSEYDGEIKVQFHSQDSNSRLLTLAPKDPYEQTQLPRYRGFVQAFSEMQPTHLAKVQIQLIKLSSDRNTQVIWKSPFMYKPRDAVTREYLEALAMQVQDNWPTLADKLGLSKERCSVIKNSGNTPSNQALDMLIDWLKATPYATNKVDLLATALHSAGYSQQASRLRREQRRLQETAG